MDTVLRGLIVYFILLVLFRMAGRRTLANMTTFDLVLTLIISEAVQQALIDDDKSMTAAVILITTLIGLDIAVGLVERRVPFIARWTDSVPVMLIENGAVHEERLKKERMTIDDILMAARENGLEKLEQVKHAILEKGGKVNIIKAEGAA